MRLAALLIGSPTDEGVGVGACPEPEFDDWFRVGVAEGVGVTEVAEEELLLELSEVPEWEHPAASKNITEAKNIIFRIHYWGAGGSMTL